MVAARGVAGACVFARVKQGKGEKEITCMCLFVLMHECVCVYVCVCEHGLFLS